MGIHSLHSLPSWIRHGENPCFSIGRPRKAWNIPYFSSSHLGYVVIWVAVGTSGLSGDQLVKSHMSRSAVSHVFSCFLMFSHVFLCFLMFSHVFSCFSEFPTRQLDLQITSDVSVRFSQYALEDAGSEIFWADTPGHNDALWFLMVSSCLLGKCLQDGFGCEPHMEDHGSHQVSTGRDMLKKEMRTVLELRRIEKMGHDGSLLPRNTFRKNPCSKILSSSAMFSSFPIDLTTKSALGTLLFHTGDIDQ